MIPVIAEGFTIPNGLSIKVGFLHQIENEPKRYITQGKDGLIESVLYDYAPITYDDTKPWVTFILQFGWFRVSYRMRSWSTNLFRIG